MKTLLIVDGYAMIHRAYHALPPLTNRDGKLTNAVYGFFSMLHKAIIDFNPQYLAICFDTPKKTFRKELFSEYQAQRPKSDPGLHDQIPEIKQLLDQGKIARIEAPGFEADDVIGTLATVNKKNTDLRIIILTGDRDIMQLTDKNILILTPQKGISEIHLYSPEEVEAKLGIKPEQIPDYKALAGDASDNYPGVAGIGPKTAAGLIQQFGSVENLLRQTEKVENTRIREKIIAEKDKIILFKKIATIVKDLEIKIPLAKLEFKGFHPEMKTGLNKLQLYSLLKRFYAEKEDKPVNLRKEAKSKTDNQMNLF